MSKGSKRRPRLIDRELYESNWDMIFSDNDSCGGLPVGWLPGGRNILKRKRMMKNGESLKEYCSKGPKTNVNKKEK